LKLSDKDKVQEESEQQTCQEAARDEKISELEILKQSLEEKQKEAKDYYDQLLRLKADFENFRKRSEKEKKDYLEWGKEKILIKQISIDDVLEQALKSAKSGGKVEDIITGLEMVTKEFSKMLKEEGVEEIKCEKFDPNVCEALDTVESQEEDGSILDIYQKGYTINGRLLRAAKVKVAKRQDN
jgi:molecular chaperone GrpE